MEVMKNARFFLFFNWLTFLSMFILNSLLFFLHFYIFKLINSLFVNLLIYYLLNYISKKITCFLTNDLFKPNQIYNFGLALSQKKIRYIQYSSLRFVFKWHIKTLQSFLKYIQDMTYCYLVSRVFEIILVQVEP